MNFAQLKTQGIVARNSLDYIKAVLKNLQDGVVSVPLSTTHDTYRLEITQTNGIIDPEIRTGWSDFTFTSGKGEEAAQISFTSGTEGLPKAVVLSRNNLHEVVERVSRVMGITSEIREYVGVPVYHSFGYGRCRLVLNAGGKFFIPENGFNLAEIRTMLQNDEINAISAVPSLWRLFLAEKDKFGPELERVKWVEIGSQSMSEQEKKDLRTLLPNANIVQHYGLTEASRTTLLKIHEATDSALTSVGGLEDNGQIRINGDSRIEIQGPQVCMGVLKDGTYHTYGPDAWFETSDCGRWENGLLYFEGRADDLINCGGIKISPDEMESYVRSKNAEAGAFAISRVTDPMRGEGILLITTPDTKGQEGQLIDLICAYTETQNVSARSAIKTLTLDSIPKTDTGKVQRKELIKAYEAHVTETSQTNANAGQSDLLNQLFNGAPVDASKSFRENGGDSLLNIQMSLAIENALGAPLPNWEDMPLEDIIDKISQTDEAVAFLSTPAQKAPPLNNGDKNNNPDDISFLDLIREDFRTNDASLVHQGFWMLLIHRFGNWRMGVKPKILRMPLTILYRVLNKCTQIFFGMKLDYTVKVGRRVKLEHFGGMILGAREIGNDVILRQNTTFGIRAVDDLNAKPTIGNNVDIGAGAVIVGNVKIGDNCIIGANSLIFTDVAENSIMMGVPAKKIANHYPKKNNS